MMHGDRIKVFGLGLVLTVLGFALAYQFVEPAPPGTLRIATGGEGGAYHRFGEFYRDALARDGIRVELVPSGGSLDNLRLLRDGKVDIAFVQGGTADALAEGRPQGLSALASLYREPLWVFVRSAERPSDLRGLRDRRIALGGEGSGTRPVVLDLLADNALTEAVTPLPLSGEAARNALVDGEVDAVAMVSGITGPAVQAMLGDPALAPIPFPRAEAYALRHRYLSRVVLPEGTVDPGRDVPDANLTLVAPAATLVATENLHPAFVTLVLRAARTIHGAGGIFEAAGEFPSAAYLEFPLNDEAQRFYQSGPPLLQRFLPFWAADLVDRLKVMLIPLLTLMLPLFKILPPAYRWRVRSRIYRWYRDLLEIEAEAKVGTADLSELETRLTRIDDEVSHVSVPLSYADAAYSLRMHIDLVRASLKRLKN